MRALLHFPQFFLSQTSVSPSTKTDSKAISTLIFLTLFLTLTPSILPAQDEVPLQPVVGSPIPTDLRKTFLSSDLEKGLAILDQLEKDTPDRLQDWLFYRAALLEQSDQSDSALEILTRLESKFPSGAWFHRARFMKARLLVEIGRFGEAQRIIEQETLRLHSEERRQRLAQLLIDEGNLLSEQRDPGVVEDKSRDLRKAYAIYQQVAELNPPSPLLEQALFALVRCSAELNSSQVIADADRYIANFDYRDKQGQEVEEEGYIGKNLLTVLLTRTRAMNPVKKRRALEDLIARIDDEISGHPWRARFFTEESKMSADEIRQEALLRIVHTYSEFASRLAAMRRFLSEAKNHPKYWEIRFDLGNLQQQNSDVEGSIQHWRELFDEIPKEKSDSDLGKLRAGTLFSIGLAYWNIVNLEEALSTFRSYVSEFPDGADWAKSQGYCIDIEAEICERLLYENNFADARTAIAEFSLKYPIHAKTLRLLYLSARTYAQEARQQREESSDTSPAPSEEVSRLFNRTLSELRALNGKYPSTTEGQRALFDVGRILEEDLLKPAEAVEAYRECFGGPFEGQARFRLSELTRVHLSIETERLYRSTDAASFTLDSRNLEEVKVDLFPIDIEAYFRKYQSRNRVEQLDLDLIDPWKTIEVKVKDYEPYRPCSQLVEIPVEGQGTWAVVVTAGEFRATTLVVRTDLDIIVQAGRDDVLIYAQDMVNMKPAVGTRILIATPGPDNQPVIRDVRTGSDGTILLQYDDLDRDDSVRVLAMLDDNSAVAGLGLGNTLVSRGLSPLSHILMSSATYQPGDRVQWSAVIRDLKDQRWIIPGEEAGRVRIFDPEGMEIFRQESVLSSLGTLHGSFELPIGSPMGLWQLQVTSPQGFSTSQSFNVEIPKPLPIQMEFSSTRNVYVRGEQIELKVTAQTWYGKPLAGAPVTIQLPYLNELVEKELILDDQGSAKFDFDSRTAESSTLSFNAYLREEGVQRSLTIPLRQKLWEIALEIPRKGGRFMIGESVPITVKATDLSGEGISREVSLKLTERVRRSNRWNDRNLTELVVKTDESGVAEIRVPLEKAGNLTLKAEGVDRWGHPILAQESIRVYGDSDATELIWLVEDAALVTGEKRELNLHCTGAAGPALMTILGDHLVSHRIIDLRNGKNTITFSVSPEIRSAATLRVAKMDESGLQDAETTFKIRRKLKVNISPPAGPVDPGSEVTLEVETLDLLDQPVSAEIALAVLDASIDDLYPNWFRELNISQSNHDPARILSLSSSCEFRYTGITKTIEQNLLNEMRRIEQQEMEDSVSLGLEVMANADFDPPRESAAKRMLQSRSMAPGSIEKGKVLGGGAAGEFGYRFGRGQAVGGLTAEGGSEAGGGNDEIQVSRYLAFWEGALVTDENGKGSVTFRIPDRSSTWRIRSRGVASGDLFGEEDKEFLSREDLVIESLIPFSAIEGDVITPRIRIFNDTQLQTQAKITLSWPSGDGESQSDANIALLPGMQEVLLERWPALGTEDERPYRIEVQVGDRTYLYNGSVKIQRWGLDVYSLTGWNLEDETTSGKIGFADRESLLDRKLRLTLGSSIDAGLIDRLTSSRDRRMVRSLVVDDHFTIAAKLLGIIEALNISTARGAELKEPIEQDLRQQAENLIRRLVTAQKSRGDWPWLPTKSNTRDSFSDSVTAFVFESLSTARAAGFTVPDTVFNRATPFLEKRFRDTDQGKLNQKAILLAALSSNGSGDFGAANRLHRNRSKLSNAGLAALIRGLNHLQRDTMSQEVALTLLERQQEDGSWSNEKSGSAEMSLYRLPRFLTALCLHALTKTDLAAARSESAARWLKSNLTFYLDRGSALSIAALLRWQGTTAAKQRDCEVTISIAGLENGAQLASLKVGEGKLHDSIVLDLAAGQAELNLTTKLIGDSGAFFTAELTGKYVGYPEFKDRDFSIRDANFLAAAPRMAGRTLPTGFSILKKNEERWRNIVQNLSPGETAQFELNLTGTKSQQEFVSVELKIPSGLMLDQESLKGNFTYKEIDNGLLKVWGTLRSRMNINFSVVATSPGEYRMPPVIIRSVAEPQRMTLGKSQVLTVINSGETSPDDYKPSPDEIYSRGSRLWEDSRWREARSTLEPLWEEYSDELRSNPAREIARILMLSAMEAGDNSSMVSFFEILKERNPDLTLSLSNFIRLGEAYRTLGESSRSLQIFMAVNEAIFARDRKVSDLLSESDLIPALNLLQQLTMENPATPAVLAAEQYLADVSLKASAARNDFKTEEKIQLGLLGRRILYRFLTLHGDDPTAPDAGLNLVSSLLSRKNWSLARRESERLAQRYQKPRYLDSFRYTQAVAMWALGEDEAALNLLEQIADSRYPVASGGEVPSENRDLALFIIGQIHHAANQPQEASKYYEMIKDQFADARDSLRQINARELELDEISEFRPGEPISIELRYRNIENAEVLAYKVNLMTLALREQDLSRVTEVNLSGISPTLSKTVELGAQGTAGGTLPATRNIDIPIEDEGAYLVIARGGDVHTSCLILVNRMEMVVKETNGSLRIQIVDPTTGKLLPDVEVRILNPFRPGSEGATFGTTDRRGLVLANTEGPYTVIARRGKSDYAFHRAVGSYAINLDDQDGIRQMLGETYLGVQQLQMEDYFGNVLQFNADNSDNRNQMWRSDVENTQQGIQIKKATD
ncbi:MAG: hypothetical protein CBC13_06205 [Planctomycetia bacterium TMED53]|nr:MAG: hypothetical protein CBC13_06205 [Planctomycetia bacterium TMED53]